MEPTTPGMDEGTRRAVETFDWSALKESDLRFVPRIINDPDDTEGPGTELLTFRLVNPEGYRAAIASVNISQDYVVGMFNSYFAWLVTKRFDKLDAKGQISGKVDQLISKAIHSTEKRLEAELHAIAREHLAKAIKAKIDAAVMRLDITLPQPKEQP